MPFRTVDTILMFRKDIWSGFHSTWPIVLVFLFLNTTLYTSLLSWSRVAIRAFCIATRKPRIHPGSGTISSSFLPTLTRQVRFRMRVRHWTFRSHVSVDGHGGWRKQYVEFSGLCADCAIDWPFCLISDCWRTFDKGKKERMNRSTVTMKYKRNIRSAIGGHFQGVSLSKRLRDVSSDKSEFGIDNGDLNLGVKPNYFHAHEKVIRWSAVCVDLSSIKAALPVHRYERTSNSGESACVWISPETMPICLRCENKTWGVPTARTKEHTSWSLSLS